MESNLRPHTGYLLSIISNLWPLAAGTQTAESAAILGRVPKFWHWWWTLLLKVSVSSVRPGSKAKHRVAQWDWLLTKNGPFVDSQIVKAPLRWILCIHHMHMVWIKIDENSLSYYRMRFTNKFLLYSDKLAYEYETINIIDIKIKPLSATLTSWLTCDH